MWRQDKERHGLYMEMYKYLTKEKGSSCQQIGPVGRAQKWTDFLLSNGI